VAADADVAHTFVVHHRKGRLPADGSAKRDREVHDRTFMNYSLPHYVTQR